MNLCIDIGNTRTKLALFDRNEILDFKSFLNEDLSPIQGWITMQKYSELIMSSVQKIDHPVHHFLSSHYNPYTFNAFSKLPISIQYNTPETLGQDRIAALCGASELYSAKNIFIVNAGTCVTYDFLEAGKRFFGGNIAPGLKMRWRAMHEMTGRLPSVNASLGPINHFFGQNTTEAMYLGGIQGIRSEIEYYFRHLLAKYHEVEIVLTGGDATLIGQLLDVKWTLQTHLVLFGLNVILNQR